MQAIPSLAAEVLFYAAREAARNAARYGRGEDTARPLHLRVAAAWHHPSAGSGEGGLEILVEDDGVGLGGTAGAERGSGQGLALHSTMLAVVGGSLVVESVPDVYTRVWLRLRGGPEWLPP
jgi:signal transduction histidine kinase